MLEFHRHVLARSADADFWDEMRERGERSLRNSLALGLVTLLIERALEESILQLPAQYRTVVMLRDIEEMSTAETAAALGSPSRMRNAVTPGPRSGAQDVAGAGGSVREDGLPVDECALRPGSGRRLCPNSGLTPPRRTR